MKKYLLFLLLFIMIFNAALGKSLNPGFDKEEYMELLKIGAQTNESKSVSPAFYPEKFRLVYTSPLLGLDNLWTLWVSDDSIAAIAIRGTSESSTSWIANLYAAMVPAKGELTLTEDYTFQYELSPNPLAAVHVGWLIATGFLSRDILEQIDTYYQQGIKDFYITGHSQGGGIAFLMSSHLRSLQQKGDLPNDIQFKTYCSAGPKPGNLYYAYDYALQTQDGWAYNVVNQDDCVPMLPFTIQTFNDFLANSPFESMKTLIDEQEIPHKMVLNFIFKKMDTPSQKAMEAYQKYLGVKMEELIKKHLAEYNYPEYFPSHNYVSAGNQYILVGTEEYYKQFSPTSENLIEHHSPAAYYFIVSN